MINAVFVRFVPLLILLYDSCFHELCNLCLVMCVHKQIQCTQLYYFKRLIYFKLDCVSKSVKCSCHFLSMKIRVYILSFNLKPILLSRSPTILSRRSPFLFQFVFTFFSHGSQVCDLMLAFGITLDCIFGTWFIIIIFS